MKNVFCLLFSLIIVSAIHAQDVKQRIAVLDLDPTGISLSEAQFLTDRLRTELFETGSFQVVERDKMNAILSEQGFQQTGCTTVECAVEIGQLLNVKQIVAGSIGKIEELYSISLRLIDVQSGAIVRTATRDYRGKLSEVLTEIIPEIAVIMAKEDKKPEGKPVEPKAKTTSGEKSKDKRWGVMLKGGWAFLGYTSDVNKKIADYNATHAWTKFDNNYSNHRNFAIEFNYFLSKKWQLKLGLGSESMINAWNADEFFISQALIIKGYEQKFNFSNLSLGINYYLLKNPAGFDWYVGTDIGSMQLSNHVTADQTAPAEDFDKTYQYSVFAFKIVTGGGYYVFKSLRLGIELALQATGEYDLSAQNIADPEPNLTEDQEEIFMLTKFPASGILINFTLGYHF
jgi:hypothetical protein